MAETVVEKMTIANSSKIFKSDRILQLLGTSSPVCGNLALSKESGNIAVIHPGYLSILNIEGSEKAKIVPCRSPDGDGPTMVSQVLWCKLGNATWLAIASSRGLQIFDEEGTSCTFSHACHDGQDSSSVSSCALSLTAVANQVLCVGCSTGYIYVFRVLDKQYEAVLSDRQRGHDFGVSCLASPEDDLSSNILASGDNDGNVSIWNLPNDRLKKEATFYSYGFGCTALCWWQGKLAVAYGSGHIRMYSVVPQATLLVEVAAHSRWITGMDIAIDADRLLTVSEDAFVRIWQLTDTQPMIQHLFNIHVQDAFLVGGRFLTSAGSSFCVSSYDCDQVSLLHIRSILNMFAVSLLIPIIVLAGELILWNTPWRHLLRQVYHPDVIRKGEGLNGPPARAIVPKLTAHLTRVSMAK